MVAERGRLEELGEVLVRRGRSFLVVCRRVCLGFEVNGVVTQALGELTFEFGVVTAVMSVIGVF